MRAMPILGNLRTLLALSPRRNFLFPNRFVVRDPTNKLSERPDSMAVTAGAGKKSGFKNRVCCELPKAQLHVSECRAAVNCGHEGATGMVMIFLSDSWSIVMNPTSKRSLARFRRLLRRGQIAETRSIAGSIFMAVCCGNA